MFPSRQSIAIVAFILSLNIDVNAKSEDGETALHYLCEHQCLDQEEHIVAMFDLIVKKGGSCEIKNKWQDTPLHSLCKYRFSATPLPLDVLKRFKGKVMNEVNESGMTPLHIACDYNRLSQYSNPKSTCMRRLWIDVKRVAYYRKWKRTGYVEGIRYLLTHGGQPSLRIQDDKGRTPYDLAHRAGFRKPCVCCGIVCCNEELPLPCFPIPHADHTEKELLLAVDPLADSVCPKLSYCCWATRTNTKLSMIMVASGVILLAKILFFAYRYIL